MKYFCIFESALEKKSLTGISAGSPWHGALQAPSPAAMFCCSKAGSMTLISFLKVRCTLPEQHCTTSKVTPKLPVLD